MVEFKTLTSFLCGGTLLKLPSSVTVYRELKYGKEIGRDTFTVNGSLVDLGEDAWQPEEPLGG